MTDLMVQIDGQMVPLADCAWSMWASCGCMVAITLASTPGDRVLATQEQAHKELTPLKRDRDRETRLGYTFRLITMTHYRSEIGALWECEQHRKPAA